MEKVTRAHLAGLELALDKLDISGQDYQDLQGLIAEASASPEQEAVSLNPAAYRTIDEYGSCTLSIGKIHQDSRALVLADHAERLIRFGRYEIERLRAELEAESKGADKAAEAMLHWKKEADSMRNKLAEAQALLRESHQAYAEAIHWEDQQSVMKKIDAFLSATAQPAERNQCDGCQAGVPLVDGAHRMGKPGGYPDDMSCQASKYNNPSKGRNNE